MLSFQLFRNHTYETSHLNMLYLSSSNHLGIKPASYRRGCGNIHRHRSSWTLNGPFRRGRCTPSPTSWAQSPACPRTELTWGGLARSGCCLTVKHDADVKENHRATEFFQDKRLVTDPPQTRAQGSRSSCWPQWSLWNKISTGWTSTRPPWWWRSPPFHLLRWSSSPPWPWCRRWRSSPGPSAGRPKSGPPESSSRRSDLNPEQLTVEADAGSMQKAATSWSKIPLFLIHTGDEGMAARLHREGVGFVFVTVVRAGLHLGSHGATCADLSVYLRLPRHSVKAGRCFDIVNVVRFVSSKWKLRQQRCV